MGYLDADSLLQLQQYGYQAASLLVYQSVLDAPPGRAFLALIQALQREEPEAALRAYGQWFSALAVAQQSWQTHLISQLLRAENPFTRQVQRQGASSTDVLRGLPKPLVDAVRHDLQLLRSLYDCRAEQLSQWVQLLAQLSAAPTAWALEDAPDNGLFLRDRGWAAALPDLVDYYQRHGTGLFAEYRVARWQKGALVGVAHADTSQLQQLVGYEQPKQALIQNTEVLLAGLPALHVLLYGSRGSGKSSLVKALVNQYGDRGLRLIEVTKADLHHLPHIVEQLRDLPQKFIIFVDDLSFEEDDEAFKALKVVLEGNVVARPLNVVVYATSNRRHLIREFFGDRPRPSDADEVHQWDTVQEKLSFSDRFGLTLTFEPADQPRYLTIVRHLAQQENLQIEPKDLEFQALQWATRHNGRSGRTARQFIDYLTAELTAAERSL